MSDCRFCAPDEACGLCAGHVRQAALGRVAGQKISGFAPGAPIGVVLAALRRDLAALTVTGRSERMLLVREDGFLSDIAPVDFPAHQVVLNLGPGRWVAVGHHPPGGVWTFTTLGRPLLVDRVGVVTVSFQDLGW